MSNIREFKTADDKAREELVKQLRWLADQIEDKAEFHWTPDVITVSVASPSTTPVIYTFGSKQDDSTYILGHLTKTKQVAIESWLMESTAPPEGPDV